MISNDEYQKITKDISGSRIKNRFSYEMTYGIKLLYQLYEDDIEDFYVIFDYACDIEEGINNSIIFYQLKTTSSPFTLKKLLVKDNKTNKKSILQTLIDLNRSLAVEKLFIVSNMGLSGSDTKDKKLSNVECFSFGELNDDDKMLINQNIVWPKNKCDIDKIFFCISETCLKKVSQSLLSYSTAFLDKIYNGKPSKPIYLNNCILSMVKEKADYEYDTLTLQDTIKYKGITKKDLSSLLETYEKDLINSSFADRNKVKKSCEDLNLPIGEINKILLEYQTIFGCGYVKEQYIEQIKKIKLAFQIDYASLQYKKAIKEIAKSFKFDMFLSIEAKYVLTIFAYNQL